MKNKFNRLLIGSAVTLFWVTAWWMLSGSIDQEILFPSPTRVAQTLWTLWGTRLFWRSVALSLLRILGGFAAAVAVGSLLAVVTAHSRAMHVLLSPLLHIVQAAPVASFIILAYVWIEAQLLPAFIAFLMVVPLVWRNMCAGIENTDKKLIEMARVFHLTRQQVWLDIRLPSLRPYFTAACTTGLGFAWKAGVAAEVICTPENSIGKHLYSAKAYLETPEVFAWTVTVVLLSVILERAFVRLVQRKKEVGA